MIRQYHRMLSMDDSRLTKQIFLWDKELNQRNIVSTWCSEVRGIFTSCNASEMFESSRPFDLKLFVASMKEAFTNQQNEYLSTECGEKPKLRTFNLFKDFQAAPVFTYKPLSFPHRRMMAKLRLGCLPLRIETGRYSIPRLPERERKCLVCRNHETLLDPSDPESIENEAHYLFQCAAYVNEREVWYGKMSLPDNFGALDFQQKFKIVLNHPENIKPTANFILNAYNIRSKIIR